MWGMLGISSIFLFFFKYISHTSQWYSWLEDSICGQRVIPVDCGANFADQDYWLSNYLSSFNDLYLLFYTLMTFSVIFRNLLSLNYPRTRSVSRPSSCQRNFSCAEGRRWRLWPASPQRGDCEGRSIEPAAIILRLARVSWQLSGLLVCVCLVRLGGYLFRRMPPIWGLTAVLSESFS